MNAPAIIFSVLILLVTFLSTLFFNKADWKPQVPKEVTPKVDKSPPQAKVKKSNLKPKPQKKEQKPSSTENTVMPEEIPPPPSLPPPIDIPADDDDDNFGTFMINLLTNQHEIIIAIYCLLAYSRKKLLIGRIYCLVS